MTNLKFGLLLTSVICLAGFFQVLHFPAVQTGIGAVVAPYRKWFALLNALLYFSAFCGIQWRIPVTWKFGFVFLGLSYLEFMVDALIATAHVDAAWLAQTGIVLGGAAVGAYWSRWWYLQRSYFVHNT